MIEIDEVERNRNVFKLLKVLIDEKRFEEIVMLGEILIGDKHPSILQSFQLCIGMCEDERVQEIYNRVITKLDEMLKDSNG